MVEKFGAHLGRDISIVEPLLSTLMQRTIQSTLIGPMTKLLAFGTIRFLGESDE
jgi:hypothetical protein